MEFWDRVKGEIKTQNTTQEWIAKKAGIVPGTIKQQIHHNRLPDIIQGQKIAEALETTVEYLVTGKPPANMPEDILSIVNAAKKLNSEGKKAALGAIQGLQAL
jgi:hypothetical protein